MNLQELKRKVDKEKVKDTVIWIHHRLMKEYGWIPYKEFLELPTPVVQGLLACIKEEYDKQKREIENAKDIRRVR